MSAMNETARVRVELDGQQAGLALEKLKEKAKGLSQELTELRQANDLVNYNKKQKELKGVEAQMRSYQKAVVDTTHVLKNLNGASLKDLQMAKRDLTAQIRTLNRASVDEIALFKKKQGDLKAINAEINRVNQSMYVQQGFLNRTADSFNKYFGMITTVTAAFTGLYMSIRKMVTLSRDYEKSLDSLSAATGLAGDDLTWLSEQAKVMSTQTVAGGVRITKSASEILEAYKLLASAKPELMEVREDLAGMTQETLILAEAAEMDLGDAVTSMTTIMNQYGAGADQARKYINALAAGAKYGAAFIPQVADSLKEFGVNAKTANISVEQSVALIETMAEKGLMGSRAGIMLRNVLSKLETQSDDLRPSIVGVDKALENLDARHLSVAERVKMFGERNQVAAQILTQNTDKVKYYTQVVTGTNAAIEQGIINTDNASSAISQASNKLMLMAMDLGQKIAPLVAKSINAFSNFVKILANLPEFYQKNKTAILGMAAALGVLMGNKIKAGAIMVAQNLILKEGIGLRLKEAVVSKAAAIQEEYLAFAKAKGTKATNLATLATYAWNKALAANPVGLVIAAISALVGAIRLYDKYSAESQRLEEHKTAVLEEVKKANESLTKSYEDQSAAISDYTKLSIQQRDALIQQVDSTLKLAEAELILLKAKRDSVAQDNYRLNTGQKIMAFFLGANAMGYEAVKSLKNSADATSEMDTELASLQARITELQDQKFSLDDIVYAESHADEIALDTLANIEEKIRLYQVALKNAAFESEEFYRILGKIKDAEKIQTQLTVSVDTELNVDSGSLQQSIHSSVDQVQEAIDTFHQEAYVKTLSANQQEIQAIREKYDKYIQMARDNLEQVRTLEALRDEELTQKSDEQIAKAKENFDALKIQKDEFLSELHTKTLDDRSKELLENQNHWNSVKSQLKAFHSQGVITEQEYAKILMNITRLSREDQRKINTEFDQKEIQGNAAKNQAILEANTEALQGTLGTFSNAIGAIGLLFDQQSEEFRAVAIFQATVDTFAAAVAAYKSTVTIPIAGPTLAPIAAATAVAFGLAQVAKISMAEYREGGYTGEGAPSQVAGVVHKEEYVVPAYMMENPLVKSYVQEIEELRTTKGYKEGGHVGGGNYRISPSIVKDPQVQRAQKIIELITQNPVLNQDTSSLDVFLGFNAIISDLKNSYTDTRELLRERDEIVKSIEKEKSLVSVSQINNSVSSETVKSLDQKIETVYDSYSEKISKSETVLSHLQQVAAKRDQQILATLRYTADNPEGETSETYSMDSSGSSVENRHYQSNLSVDRSSVYHINTDNIRGIDVPSVKNSLSVSPVTPVINMPDYPSFPQQQTPEELLAMLEKLMKKLDDPIHANVSWWDIKQKNDDFDKIKKAIGI